MSTRHLWEYNDASGRWYCLRCRYRIDGRNGFCNCLRDADTAIEQIACPACNGCGAGPGLHDCEACRGKGQIGMLVEVEIDEGEDQPRKDET